MAEIVPYRSIFWKHKAHWSLLGLAAAIPLVSAHLFGLIVGVGLYIIGIINIPESKLFKKIVDLEAQTKSKEEAEKKRQEFIVKRDRQIESLSSDKRGEYSSLVETCEEIESSFDGIQGGEMFMAKVEEVMWTYLKLLSIQQSLERFMRAESVSDIDRSLKEVTNQVSGLQKEIEVLKGRANVEPSMIEHKEKLLISCNDRMNTINGRKSKIQTATDNLELVMMEKSRLIEQIRFIRAEVISNRNPDAISFKLDNNLQTLGETNKWISQMNEFQDMTEGIPSDGSSRIGFGVTPTVGTVGELKNNLDDLYDRDTCRGKSAIKSGKSAIKNRIISYRN